MSYSTISSSKALRAGGILSLLFLTGCACLCGPPISPYEVESQIPDEVELQQVQPDFSAPIPEEAASLVPDEVDSQVLDEVDLQVLDEVESETLDKESDSALELVDLCGSAEVTPRRPLNKEMLIAVLPAENLSGQQAPLEAMNEVLRWHLENNQLRLVEDRITKRFMRRNRIRHTGGIDSQAAKALVEDSGADAVLITSLETYYDNYPPRVSMTSRLVSTGEQAGIIWMDSIGFSGDESPGLLGLGRIYSPDLLVDKSIESLATSLMNYLPETTQTVSTDPPASSPCTGAIEHSGFSRRDPRLDALPSLTKQKKKTKRKYRPQLFFSSLSMDPDRQYRVAVIPFLNLTKRKNAGDIVTLDFVNQLLRDETFTVVEPGLVREQLLKYRIVMSGGPSFAAESLIASESSLGVDFIFSGTVFDYQDTLGVPKVDFGIKVYEARSGNVVWASRSYNYGMEGVIFFNVGRLYTARALNTEMVRGTFELLTEN